jgi:hypothetical protein
VEVAAEGVGAGLAVAVKVAWPAAGTVKSTLVPLTFTVCVTESLFVSFADAPAFTDSVEKLTPEIVWTSPLAAGVPGLEAGDAAVEMVAVPEPPAGEAVVSAAAPTPVATPVATARARVRLIPLQRALERPGSFRPLVRTALG